MSGPSTRLTRLVRLAERREDQARQVVARARQGERTAMAEVADGQAALRQPAPAGTALRFEAALQDLGRHTLAQAEVRAAAATTELEGAMSRWHDAHRHRGTLERLDDRLRDAALAARKRAEQHEADDLATTRGHR